MILTPSLIYLLKALLYTLSFNKLKFNWVSYSYSYSQKQKHYGRMTVGPKLELSQAQLGLAFAFA